MFWGLVASMYIGNVLLLILNLPLVAVFAQILKMPGYAMYPLILGVSIVGVYTAGSSMFQLGLLALFGLLGYLMRKLDYPTAPLVLGLVLGDSMERALRQSLMMSQGDPSILLRPIPSVLLGLAALLLAVPLFKRFNALRVQMIDREA
jgi:putative tricarboxylic transport membrane protein